MYNGRMEEGVEESVEEEKEAVKQEKRMEKINVNKTVSYEGRGNGGINGRIYWLITICFCLCRRRYVGSDG